MDAITGILTNSPVNTASPIFSEGRYLPGLVKGEKIGSLCLTEPGAGSDALGGMKTAYEQKGAHFEINGSKTFITNAPVADVFLVYARNGKSYSAFILEREDGVETPRKIPHLVQ